MATAEQLRSYLKRVTADLHRARQRLHEFELGDPEPIAIVGMACRYPGGVASPEDLWSLVDRGGDAITPSPSNRGWEAWLGDDGSGVRGGFLHDAGEFDAPMFGVSPREAIAMDPQQRILLEVTWEALERSGFPPTSMRGTNSGVFVGLMGSDYMGLLDHGKDGAAGDFGLTGLASSVVSGRVSYVLGLEGPALTLDTACSSSLVALHLASQALRSSECDLALAAGVTVMTTPLFFAAFPALASDGRCKPFSARADGVGWSEGAGVLVLERLADAQRNGHKIWALVRGSAVNQDGASNGLTAPSGPAQQRVIRQALVSAGVSADEVDVVEAHGTGTVLGDPIEAQAILATYGQGRPAEWPLWLGSVKSNIGHTSAAAGAAGVIKMAFAMHHGELPATLHIDEPSPHVDWSSGRVELLTEPRRWATPGGRPRRAAVSSFGISGTNAHVILEQPPAADHDRSLWGPPGGEAGPHASAVPVPLVVSGGSPEALAEQADRLARHLLTQPGQSLADVGWSLARTRASLAHRGVVMAAGRDAAEGGLQALAAGETAAGAGVVAGRVRGGGAGRMGFLFSGQGSQRAGMGRGLYDAFPLFAETFDEVCAAFEEPLGQPFGQSLRSVVLAAEGSPEASLVDETVFTQAGLFAVEVALVRLLDSWDVRPDVVSGHSIGELVAAHVAGMFSLEDACRLVGARGRLMQALPADGAMAALEASEAEAAELIAGLEDRVSLAALNSPSSVVVSGEAATVDDLADRWRAGGRRATRLRVGVGFHSPQVERMLGALGEVAASVDYRSPQVPLVSNVTGQLAGDEVATADYWVRHARQAVRFGDAITTMVAERVSTLVEVGPDAQLVALAHENLGAVDDVACLPTLRRGRDETAALVRSLAEVWVRGFAVDWSPLLSASSVPKLVDLPTYAFQRERFWPTLSLAASDPTALGQMAVEHPVLGAGVESAGSGAVVFTGRLSLGAQPWLADHAVAGVVLMPGTGLVELASTAGRQLGCGRLDELVVEAPLVLPEADGVDLQVELAAADDAGRREVTVHARPGPGEPWVRHASGVAAPDHSAADVPAALPEVVEWAGGDGADWPPPGADPVEIEGLYDAFAEVGLAYGPAFRGVRAVWRTDDGVYAEVALPDDHADGHAFGVHPAVFDAALHPLAVLADAVAEEGTGRALLPFAWTGVTVGAPTATTARVLRVRLTPAAQPRPVEGVADEPRQLEAVPCQGLESLGDDETIAAAPGPLHTAAPPPDVPAGEPTPLRVADESFTLPAGLPGPSPLTVAAGPASDVTESAESAESPSPSPSLGSSPFAAGPGAVAVQLADELGQLVVAVESLVLREPPADLASARAVGDPLYVVEWEPIEAGVAARSPTGVWSLVGADDLGLLTSGLTARPYPDLATLAAAVDAGAVLPDVVVVVCAPEDDVVAGLRSGLHRALDWAQQWLADERFSGSRLVVVTRGAVAVGDDDTAAGSVTALTQASVWGLVCSAKAENPGRFVLVDVDSGADVGQAPGQMLVAAVASGESEVAVRGGQLWRRHLVRPALPPPPPSDDWELALATPGVLESLALAPAGGDATAPLLPAQIRVAVQAAGLQFGDVLVALGMMPGEEWLPGGTPRGEGAGVVVEVGAEVVGVEVGDRVMGLLSRPHAAIAVTDHRLVVRIPAGWSYTQAAAVPSVFLTAYRALVQVADVQPGESVLIHAAAGGVGTAAVQLARHLGAEVFATAHPSKWDALAALGVDPARIGSSRDLGFAGSFDLQTDRPMDVVLNSLTGEFVDASLTLLAPGGRFVEVGKTDIRDPAEVAAAHPGVTYRNFDLLDMTGSGSGPERIGAMLTEIVGLFEQGSLQHAPLRTWPMSRAREAFRFMSQARQVGKLVLTRPGFDPQGTVLITGGTGTLGGLVARHLVERHGVRSLVLTSRQGRQAPGADQLVAGLQAAGAEVTVAACDTADRAALAELVGHIGAGPRPLRGVIHTAAVVDDGVVSLLTPERVERVVRPKAIGAWNLHEVTRDLDLSAFVLFSSASGVSGAAGQANYAAANVFLDALAEHRRRLGLAGLSLAWGQWEPASGTTGQLEDAHQARLRRSGFVPFASDEALGLFDTGVYGDRAVLVPVRIDMPALRNTARGGPMAALWQRLAGTSTRQAVAPSGRPMIDRSEFERRMAGSSNEAERLRVLADVVRAEVAAVLGHARPDAVDVESAFKDLGFDSLTAVELRNRLNVVTGLRLPATLVFDHPTIKQLSLEIHARLAVAKPAA